MPFPGSKTVQYHVPDLAWPLRKPIPRRTAVEGAEKAGLLLEKEVIQPQVPLRLPCYDFIPVTGTCLDALRRLR